MFAANTYRIWIADADDAHALWWLEHQCGQRLPAGRVLVGEIDGSPAAALSLHDGRVIADRARDTDRLLATLRIRAGAIRAYQTMPSLPQRLRAALPAYHGESVLMPAPVVRHGYDEDERLAA